MMQHQNQSQKRHWFLHCAPQKRDCMESFVAALSKHSYCTYREDPLALQEDAAAYPEAVFLIGPGAVIDSRNLCGYLTSTYKDLEVVVVKEELDDAFREQAQQAGAHWVLGAEDTAVFFQLSLLASEHEEKESLQELDGDFTVVSSAPHTIEGLADASSAPYVSEDPAGASMPAHTPIDLTAIPLTPQVTEDLMAASPLVSTTPSSREVQYQSVDDLEEPEYFNLQKETNPFSDIESLPEVEEEIPEPMNPIIVFASARGGVGKSTVSTLVALAAAKLDIHVALLDLDLSFGNIFGYFGRPKAADITSFVESPTSETLAACGERIHEGLDLFGPCSKPEYGDLILPKVPHLCSMLSGLYDLVVIDTSSSWGDATASVAQMAHKICLTSDVRTGAISSLARAAGLLVRLGVPRTKIIRLINRSDARHRDQDFFARKNPGLEQAKTYSTYDGGVEVAEFLSAGDAVSLLDIDNPFSQSCKRLSARLLQEVGMLPNNHIAHEYLEAPTKKAGTILNFAQHALFKDAS